MTESVVWSGAEGELVARVGYTLTSWGGRGGQPRGSARPTGPPGIDLTGQWQLTLFSPTGIQRLDGTLSMDPDGGLEGRFEGGNMDGSIRNGWVSGMQFGWSLRVSGRGRELDAEFSGTLEDGELRGTMDFGGLPDFESRFEGRRTGGGADAAADGDEEPADPGERPRAPDPGRTPDRPRPTAGRPGGAGRSPGSGLFPGATLGGDDSDQRARMIRQLLPPAAPRAPAPDQGSVELRIGGTRLVDAVGGLSPAVPVELRAEIPFEKLRNAALEDGGIDARVGWPGTDVMRFKGRADAGALLEAFHGPIEVTGLEGDSSSGWTGTLRVPDRLEGFTVRAVDGRWSIGGEALSDGILCSPCRRGRRLEVRIDGTENPTVRVVEPGYPRDGADAETWLRDLRGDNRAYLERSGDS